jgi:hypothetical protein
VQGEDKLAAVSGSKGEWIWERHRSRDDGVGVRNKAVGHEKIRGRERLR